MRKMVCDLAGALRPIFLAGLVSSNVFWCPSSRGEGAARVVDGAFNYELHANNVLAWSDGQRTGSPGDEMGPVAARLNEILQKTKKNLSIAAYGFQDQTWLMKQLKTLVKAGVGVNVVVDQMAGQYREWIPQNFAYPDSAKLPAMIGSRRVMPDLGPAAVPRSGSIMHDKFLVMDGESVWFGSANLSATCLGSEYNANVSIYVKSRELARIYQTEFDQMYQTRKFSTAKTGQPLQDRQLLYSDGTRVVVGFAPQDDPIRTVVLPFIQEARSTLDIAMFFLTELSVRDALTDALVRGVRVRILMDALGAASPASVHADLLAAGAHVRVENWGGKMHMKAAVADGRDVIVGSLNWSSAGNASNDENVARITGNRGLAREFSRHFEALWKSVPDTAPGGFHPRAEGRESGISCRDGIDNDHDGLIDMDDAACL